MPRATEQREGVEREPAFAVFPKTKKAGSFMRMMVCQQTITLGRNDTEVKTRKAELYASCNSDSRSAFNSSCFSELSLAPFEVR